MSRPASVSILGQKVRVRPLQEQFDDNIMGYCNIKKQLICVDSKLANSTWESVLLHESIHYISDTLGLDLTEEEVSGIGSGLYSEGVRIHGI